MLKSLPFTDKSAKNGILSVKLSEISEILVEQHYFLKDVFYVQKGMLSLIGGCHLRANPRNRRFARNG
ncbi:hypothetical protein [Ligilactobacillus ruminis]|uniref:hypothetical protein n=1 Tax=Ligilactobacillus ruminis TaxID=1623 RepID=UPI001F1CAF95|nr:hypothetical protein [Ligilactobacillus ruminis]